jgi:heme-degrading monooxygenase HmoA
MYARVTTLESPPDRMDDATRFVQEQVIPQLRQLDGFKGIIALDDRQSGKLLGVAFWDSEEALRATEEAAARIRGGVAEATGGTGTVASVENYEVAIFKVSS